MPLYEYECQSCHHRLETLQRVADPPLETCPECGGPLKRLISPPAVQFKGSGWYVTDYAGAGKQRKKEEAGGGAKESGEASSKSTTGTTGASAGTADAKKAAPGGGGSSPSSKSSES